MVCVVFLLLLFVVDFVCFVVLLFCLVERVYDAVWCECCGVF